MVIVKDHKELKSARDPNVGPPDRPGVYKEKIVKND